MSNFQRIILKIILNRPCVFFELISINIKKTIYFFRGLDTFKDFDAIY
jgi:hypothetical protein